jgi:hypothetical protein
MISHSQHFLKVPRTAEEREAISNFIIIAFVNWRGELLRHLHEACQYLGRRSHTSLRWSCDMKQTLVMPWMLLEWIHIMKLVLVQTFHVSLKKSHVGRVDGFNNDDPCPSVALVCSY